MSVLLLAYQSVMQKLCCADDNVLFLQHFPKEVLLHCLSADRQHFVVSAQVRFELILVMLIYKVNLQYIKKKHIVLSNTECKTSCLS